MRESRCVVCGRPIAEDRMICMECENGEPYFSTTKIIISLTKFRDISKFVRLASKCKDDVIITSGRYKVNAKSLMGILTLDLSKPVGVEFYGKVPYGIQEELEKYIVK